MSDSLSYELLKQSWTGRQPRVMAAEFCQGRHKAKVADDKPMTRLLLCMIVMAVISHVSFRAFLLGLPCSVCVIAALEVPN